MYTIALADRYGDVLGEPGVEALGRSGIDIVPLHDKSMMPLPAGSSLMLLQDRIAVGKLEKKKKSRQIEVATVEGEPVFPAAAVIPPGFTRTLMPAYIRNKNAAVLPFFAYTALGWKGDDLYCAAIETHHDLRWNPSMYNSLELPKKIKLKMKKHPDNRLLKHLQRCAVEYRCFTAQNIFYERWEGGIPVSAACNARCGGCISQNRLDETPSPQERIRFVPTVEEIVELAVDHLKNPEAILSFGQGCEGEPLTRGDLLIESTKRIREQTQEGTLNMNTNGSIPAVIGQLLDLGMDSIRVSLNSAIEERYNSYFKPKDYKFSNVVQSIDAAIERNKFVSLNFLYLPGVNDREEEANTFFEFLQKHPVNMIQFRNLNIDPDYYFSFMEVPKGKAIGTVEFIDEIKKQFPKIKIGNFSIPVK